MVKLPAELWFTVFSYLSKSDLPKLVGVNKLLFEYCMDRLYREINLDFEPRDIVSLKRIQLLTTESSYARRVRRLAINLPELDMLESVLQSMVFPRPSSPAKSDVISKPRLRYRSYPQENEHAANHEPEPTPYPILLGLINHLVNVNEVEFYCQNFFITELALTRIPPILDAIWSTLLPQKLTLRLPPGAFGVVLHGLSEKQPQQLVEITISTSQHHTMLSDQLSSIPTSETQEDIVSIAKLINASRTSLVSLVLEVWREDGFCCDLLGQLENIPHLAAVEINLDSTAGESVDDARGVAMFLQAHNASLRNLTLDLAHNDQRHEADPTGTPPSYTEDGLEEFELTHLHTLHINPHTKTPRHIIVARLSRYFAQPQIRIIDLWMYTISETELQTLFGSGGCPQLIELSLSVKVVTRSLFELICDKLVGLQTLVVLGCVGDEHQLVKQIVKLPLSPSHPLPPLRNLTIQSYDPETYTWILSPLLMMALAISIPTIREFDESGRSYEAIRTGKEEESQRLREAMEGICGDNWLYSPYV